MKNLEKNGNEEELNRVTLLQELKRSKQEVVQLECASKLLKQTTEGALGSTVREAGTPWRYAVRLLRALSPQYAGLAMNVTQRFRAWVGKEVIWTKHFTVEDIREREERRKKGHSRYARQREAEGLVPVAPMVAARS